MKAFELAAKSRSHVLRLRWPQEQAKVQVNGIIAELKERWLGKEYDMMTKNCNHFCVEFAEQLRVSGIPGVRQSGPLYPLFVFPFTYSVHIFR